MASNLFTTYFREQHAMRRAEMDWSIAMNAQAFDHVYVLSESCFINDPQSNLIVRDTRERQKYSDLIAWSHEVCSPSDLCVIANNDIVIPRRSIRQMEALGATDAWCLSRYEVCAGGSLRLFDCEWSQDVWAFRGPVKANAGEYHFGIPGCDNRFAHELKDAGYTLNNPAKSVVTIHMHNSRRRSATNHRRNRIPGPWWLVKPTLLGEPSPQREGKLNV